MAISIFLVDAFARGPFSGNPAGVCPLDAPADECWMQNLAMEMSQAETAFVWPLDDGFSLRWFTPELEVDLCGHATLASAHVLFETGRVTPDQRAVFHTKSGVLTCDKSGDHIRMDFPSEAPAACDAPVALMEAIPNEIIWVGRNRMDYFVQLARDSEIRTLQPDLAKLASIESRGFIFTAKSEDPEFDFVSRFFCPYVGIPEDTATGSAHCALAPFWAERLGKTAMKGFQASKRGGYVGVELRGDRVTLEGRAVTVLEGRLR